jgi:MOSC domain
MLARVNLAATRDVRRFRPNLVIATTEALEGLVEATWHGRTLRLGEVVVQGGRPTAHCVMTIQAQGDRPNDPTVLRTIVREAGQPLGIYASVVRPGRVAVGDVVDVRSGGRRMDALRQVREEAHAGLLLPLAGGGKDRLIMIGREDRMSEDADASRAPTETRHRQPRQFIRSKKLIR